MSGSATLPAAMQAVRIQAYGDAALCRLEEAPVPRPGPGEVLVQIVVAGLNFIDIHIRLGRYAKSDTYRNALPMTLGMEGAGVVVACGPGADEFAVGDRVSYCVVRGSFAQYAVVPQGKLVRVPEGIGFDAAAALMLQGLTAHYLSHSAYELKPGSTCLVHAAAGGVGGLLVQLARLRGATVIGTVGSAEKATLARALGCHHTIEYKMQDFREAALALTGGAGVDVVYDSIGRDTIARSIRSLRRRGLCINYGGASGLVEAWVREVGSAARVPRALARMTANGVVIEGFRHTLYPAGDPRTGPLLEMARQIGRRCADVRVIDAAIRYFEPRGGKPNVDVGLAALSAALGAPAGTGTVLFAVGRSAGWVAHILEQRDAGYLLRPRARYVGV